jgi:predicted AlkP superfamily pyrophosphatase or phosphodiesterase
MKFLRLCFSLVVCAALSAAPQTGGAVPQRRPPAAAAQKPKLVLAVAIDQFRFDYLLRFQADYKEGLRRLWTKGAVFTNARYEHFPTVTAIGHSTFLTGATPSISGIIGNDWWDRDRGKNITSVADESTKLLGGKPGIGASPRNMRVSTVGDELKVATGGKAKVIGISLKDRSAILPAGHAADGAYWFDNTTGNFVSSTFYFPDLPGWVKDYNGGRPGDRYRSRKWLTHAMPETLDEKLYAALAPSPFGNYLVEEFAERAIAAEQLGQRGTTDLLAVSFSSNDYVGHQMGPDAPEVREVAIETDRLLGTLFKFIESRVGMANTVVVLTADHGVAPVPETNQGRRMPGGRLVPGSIFNAVNAALTKKWGEGKWILSPSEYSLYLNWDLIAQKGLNKDEVTAEAKEAALAVPHVFRVYTRQQLMNGQALEDQLGRRVMNGFDVKRSADLTILLEPYWIYIQKGTTHGTTFSYDAHVPVIFMGPGIRPGKYHQQAAVNDIAPTLATLLEVETPSGSMGHPLAAILLD